MLCEVQACSVANAYHSSLSNGADHTERLVASEAELESHLCWLLRVKEAVADQPTDRKQCEYLLA